MCRWQKPYEKHEKLEKSHLVIEEDEAEYTKTYRYTTFPLNYNKDVWDRSEVGVAINNMW